jgi:uncharacterized membrane protein
MMRSTERQSFLTLKEFSKMKNAATGLLKQLAGCFLAGLLAVLPAVLTIGIVVWVADFVHRLIGRGTAVGKGLQSLGLNFVTNSTAAYVIGWALVLVAVFGLGLLVQLGAKRFLQRIFDGVASRVPLVGSIYGTSKQLVAMFDRKNESEMKAMSVVWCFFGKEGGAGILALMPTPEKFRLNGRDYNVVIIPTAPVPFGGALMFMPAESVQPADMSVDGLMSIYVSMGITAPQFLSDQGRHKQTS